MERDLRCFVRFLGPLLHTLYILENIEWLDYEVSKLDLLLRAFLRTEDRNNVTTDISKKILTKILSSQMKTPSRLKHPCCYHRYDIGVSKVAFPAVIPLLDGVFHIV
jgi:hypothetical protein